MNWTSFRQALPPTQRAILVAYAGDSVHDASDEEFRWAELEQCVLLERGFGHILLRAGGMQMSELEHEYIRTNGKWCLLSDLFVEVALPNKVMLNDDRVVDHIDCGTAVLV